MKKNTFLLLSGAAVILLLSLLKVPLFTKWVEGPDEKHPNETIEAILSGTALVLTGLNYFIGTASPAYKLQKAQKARLAQLKGKVDPIVARYLEKTNFEVEFNIMTVIRSRKRIW